MSRFKFDFVRHQLGSTRESHSASNNDRASIIFGGRKKLEHLIQAKYINFPFATTHLSKYRHQRHPDDDQKRGDTVSSNLIQPPLRFSLEIKMISLFNFEIMSLGGGRGLVGQRACLLLQ